MRLFALEITGGCGAKLDGFGGDFVDVPADWLRRSRLLGRPRSIGRELCRFNVVDEAPALRGREL
jgi:hypothetical protein